MSYLKEGFRRVLDSASFPLLVLCVAIVLAIVGNGIYDILKMKLLPWQLAIGGSVLLMVMAITAGRLSILKRGIDRIRGRMTTPFCSIDENFSKKRRGLIFTVGFKSHLAGSPLRKEVDVLKPDFIGFLVTSEIEEEGIVDEIVKTLNLQRGSYRIELIDPIGVNSIQSGALRVIQWMERDNKVPLDEIAIDVTSGTAPMSIGAFLAAQEQGLDVSYVFSDYDEANKPIPDSQKALVIEL